MIKDDDLRIHAGDFEIGAKELHRRECRKIAKFYIMIFIILVVIGLVIWGLVELSKNQR